MKTTAEKTSKSTSTATRTATEPFFSKAGTGTFFTPVNPSAVPSIQAKLAVSTPEDKLEKEADKTASTVMRMAEPAAPEKKEKLERKADTEPLKPEKREEEIQKYEKEKEEEKIQKAPAVEEKYQRKETGGTSGAGTAAESTVQDRASGGQPLPDDVRRYMEPRFNADFSSVRVHTDAESASLSNRLSARAFTYRNHIFFSRDQYQPGTSEGKHLLAHELTHTIQQGYAAQAQTVQRQTQVDIATTQPHIQRSVVGEILDWFADKAKFIPGFRMFTIVIGVNPINMKTVDRSPANILRALIEFMPGGALITTVLDNHGIFSKIADWIDGKIKDLGMVGQMFKDALSRFIDSLGLSDLAPWNWGSVWDRAKAIFTAPITSLISFAKGVVNDILDFVKSSILKPLAALARGTRGYDLLRAILGVDPITNEPVPQTAENLIGGFMKLIGREDIWENIKKGKAVERAFAWFKGALAGLMDFVLAIPHRIGEIFASLTFQDIITVAGAFKKIVGGFFNIAAEFISWGFQQVISLLEILFSVVAPGIMPYIKKVQATFITILKDPIGFVGNLVRAGRQGFEMFAANIVEHLKNALIKWLVGPLGDAGVYIPKSFDLFEIVKLVLSILGLTWQNIRSKLVKIIPEPVLVGLEKTASILVTLVRDGPAAAWEQIKAELSELKDQLISQIIQMVTTEVVKAAVVKLVSMLNPVGAVIQAIISIYNTITFFISKIRQIAAVVASFIDSISAIANGQVDDAAKKVEQTMANTLIVVIAFLAKFIGLGNIPERLVGIIKKIRQPIDKGLDKIVTWLGNMLKKLTGAVKAGAEALLPWWKKKVPVVGGGESHTLLFEGAQDNPQIIVRSNKPKTPAEFILDMTLTNEVKSEVNKLTNSINAIKKTLAAAQKKSPPDEAAIAVADKKITEEFNELGKILAESLDKSEEEGSINRPLPVDYPKRRAAAYPNIYTGPLTKYYLDQKWLKKAAAATSETAAKKTLTDQQPALAEEDNFIHWNGKVKVYQAAGGPNQVIKGGNVGLADEFANLAPGKILVYTEKAGTGGGSKINKMFSPYGFSPKQAGLDGDHVMERQLGGPDAIYNLWPLESKENRSSGATVKSMKVKFKNTDMTVHEARLKKPGKKIHLLVKSVK